jgi:ADP-L-glycero-D-manno-heptose 6-epimerase
MPAALRDKYQYFTRADISKLRASGYARPGTPLADAVADYVRHYLVPDKRLGE